MCKGRGVDERGTWEPEAFDCPNNKDDLSDDRQHEECYLEVCQIFRYLDHFQSQGRVLRIFPFESAETEDALYSWAFC